MTIRGDLEALGIPADDVFDWLTCADVLVFLENKRVDLTAYMECVRLLREKCGRQS